MKILMFAASFRKDSLNKKLIRNAYQMMPKGHEAMLREFNEFQMPLYDGDLEAASGLPDAAKKLVEAINSVQAVIISSPEYNAGIPGTLKNAIDWTSRDKSSPWNGKQVLLVGATPGMIGTNRGLWQIRQSLETQSAFVFPDMLGVAQAHKAFDESGTLTEPRTKEALPKLLMKFVNYADYASKYQLVKE
jgi:NAD(P)H-dependent FMN reductase